MLVIWCNVAIRTACEHKFMCKLGKLCFRDSIGPAPSLRWYCTNEIRSLRLIFLVKYEQEMLRGWPAQWETFNIQNQRNNRKSVTTVLMWSKNDHCGVRARSWYLSRNHSCHFVQWFDETCQCEVCSEAADHGSDGMSERKTFLSSLNHRTLRISVRVTFGCSLLWRWTSRGHVSQPWKISNRMWRPAPHYSKRSLPPLLPTMAGLMEQVCTQGWLVERCHMSYHYSAITPFQELTDCPSYSNSIQCHNIPNMQSAVFLEYCSSFYNYWQTHINWANYFRYLNYLFKPSERTSRMKLSKD
jgi:hypothetical protein